MANFKTETEYLIEQMIKDGDISSSEIEEIYIHDAYCNSDLRYTQTGGKIDWKAMAKELHRDKKDPWEYDDGYGAQEFAGWITFKNSNAWIERNEYDGREWWEVRHRPSLKATLERLEKHKQYLEELEKNRKNSKRM